MIENGSTVSIHYELTLDDGTQADSSRDGDPLTYTQGAGQLLPALEEALVGREPGDSLAVRLTPEQGYGEVVEAAFQEFDLEQVPDDSRAPGTLLMASDPEGNSQQVRVHEVTDDKAVLDFNHPLAGQAINFEIEIVSVDAPESSTD